MKKTLKLQKRKTIYIQPTTPFNFLGTFVKPSHFQSKLTYSDGNKYYCALRINCKVAGLVLIDCGRGRNDPKIKVEIYCTSTLTSDEIGLVKEELVSRYNLTGSISDFIQQNKNDKLLADPIKNLGGSRPSSAFSLYEFLMVTTVLQNATVRRSVQMMDAMLERFGVNLKFADQDLSLIWLPNEIEKVSEKELRDLKIGYRAKIIKKLSHNFTAGEVNERSLKNNPSKDDVKKTLLKLYGVGPQSVSYILFEVFHFYDALENVSPWEQKIFSHLMFNKKLVPVEKIITFANKRWGKWKMLALHYLFENLFWRRKNENIPWLEKEIRD